ncbi:Acetylornithine deacetylase [Thalassovita gelatinovora]|uniref:Acetylornithine deacetylase n=1 Tax=Thalassovita gelatinovora TaxID=53501 RepID=A0A0P1FVE4_THAGE|nr:acetylornithine deacetylase [Thalassovita gelatinovora]QIZ81003.1 acetylornithine deacetylase [Thalassovita gelatinovora]CUH65076.1 Acetylornithine deacetylase [Thalassovita gelatinovora]SEP86792.1 acetylornithine deacetylase [Thalassovita gelatinovora]
MPQPLEKTLAILDDLLRFDILPGRSNLDIIGYIHNYLSQYGIEAEFGFDTSGLRANLFATIGPKVDGGVALSGHTDVVPVEGQDWTRPAFELTRENGRVYGRGAVDMKGFLACALAMVPHFAQAPLKRPIHLAFSYDEEPGSIGAPDLARQIVASGMKPTAIIVGEPTEMKVIAGHKGGFERTTRFTGVAGHSSDPSRGVSAIHYAARFIGFLERLGADCAANPLPDSPFHPPFHTINVGTISGGAGRSIIAEDCQLDWELRVTPPDDGAAEMLRIETFLNGLQDEMRGLFPQASVRTETVSNYPGLRADPSSTALDLVRQISGENDFTTAPFGTDAGCFDREGLPSVVFGPGSINQAHIPDEYIEISQIEACLNFLQKLGARQSH